MFRRVFGLAGLAVLVSTAALAQLPPPLLGSTQVSGTVLFTIAAVQVQVDAVISQAAVSQGVIAAAVAQMPLPPLRSTPIPRR